MVNQALKLMISFLVVVAVIFSILNIPFSWIFIQFSISVGAAPAAGGAPAAAAPAAGGAPAAAAAPAKPESESEESEGDMVCPLKHCSISFYLFCLILGIRFIRLNANFLFTIK